MTQKQESMLKDMGFYHSQENIKNNYWIQDYILYNYFQKGNP